MNENDGHLTETEMVQLTPFLSLTEEDVKRIGGLIYTARSLGVFDFEQTIQSNMILHILEEFLLTCGAVKDGEA